VIEWLLAALLTFTPLVLGARKPWSEEVVIALSGTIVICFLLKLVFHPNQGIIWTWAYVPVGVFLLVAALQLLPLPMGLVNIISPNTAVVKTELLGDLPNADTVLKSITISFYPNATKHDLRLALAVAAVFVVVLNVFCRPDRIKRLLMAIALIGGIVTMIALAQDLFGNGKIYWFVSTPHNGAYSGPFVNHSHYGQFINLSIGAAFGLFVVKLREDFTGKRITPPLVFDYFSSPSSKILWLLVAIMSLGAATVFISLTRAGMVSMLIAAAFTILLLTYRQSLKGHSWIMVVMALAAFTCVLYIGFDAVYDRLATLRRLDNAYEDRWQILKDLLVAFGRFPVLGTGLGTHSVVYPMFSRLNTTLLFTYADNEYAQAAEETGLIGFISLIIFGVIIWSSYARSISNVNLPICSAAYGLGFGVLAILLHSLSDFGQHVPANAFLSAVFFALLLVLARIGQNRNFATQIITHSWNSRGLRITVLLGISGIWVWALIGANNFRIAEAYWKKVLVIEKDLMEKNWQGTDEEYIELISHAATASEYQPENIEYRHWLNVYRWHSISRIPDINTGTISENSISSVRDIVDEFHKAHMLCPTFGATYCIVGQIEKFILDEPDGAERIRKGYRLATCDPIACFVAGFLDVVEGRDEECIEKFKRAVQLDGSLFKDVVDIYVNHLSQPHLAISAAGNNVGQLNLVVNALEDMQYNDLAEQTREKIKDLLKAKCSQPDAPASAFASLANIYMEQQDNEAAIEYYRRALTLNYGEVHWRFELAQLLARMERVPEAVHEIRICLRLCPQFKAAREFMADLSVHPDTFSKEIKSP
jgi:tetratricopeptide (TPR) repeat protein